MNSCHNPHGSAYNHLLIGDVVGGKICIKCHNY
ncbi:cytochrome c3 family protein [Thermodesulfatator indicus]